VLQEEDKGLRGKDEVRSYKSGSANGDDDDNRSAGDKAAYFMAHFFFCISISSCEREGENS